MGRGTNPVGDAASATPLTEGLAQQVAALQREVAKRTAQGGGATAAPRPHPEKAPRALPVPPLEMHGLRPHGQLARAPVVLGVKRVAWPAGSPPRRSKAARCVRPPVCRRPGRAAPHSPGGAGRRRWALNPDVAEPRARGATLRRGGRQSHQGHQGRVKQAAAARLSACPSARGSCARSGEGIRLAEATEEAQAAAERLRAAEAEAAAEGTARARAQQESAPLPDLALALAARAGEEGIIALLRAALERLAQQARAAATPGAETAGAAAAPGTKARPGPNRRRCPRPRPRRPSLAGESRLGGGVARILHR